MSCEPQTVHTIAISPPDLDDLDPIPEDITNIGTWHGKIQAGTDWEGALQAAEVGGGGMGSHHWPNPAGNLCLIRLARSVILLLIFGLNLTFFFSFLQKRVLTPFCGCFGNENDVFFYLLILWNPSLPFPLEAQLYIFFSLLGHAFLIAVTALFWLSCFHPMPGLFSQSMLWFWGTLEDQRISLSVLLGTLGMCDPRCQFCPLPLKLYPANRPEVFIFVLFWQTWFCLGFLGYLRSFCALTWVLGSFLKVQKVILGIKSHHCYSGA